MKWSFIIIITLLSIFFLPIINAQRENITRIETVDTVLEVMSLKKQPPTLNVFGTEYVFNESGKTFLQVIDDGLSVNNACCRLTIWFPNTTSLFINDSLMIQHEQGLQFVPFIIPEIEGVYMVSAACQYFIENNFIYEEDSLDIINLTLIQGTYLGSPIVLNSRRDGLINEHDSTVGGGTKFAEANYQWTDTDLLNATNLSLQWLGASDTTGVSVNMSYFDFNESRFIQLGQVTILTAVVSETILEYITRDVPETGILTNGVNGTVLLKLRASATSGFVLVQDWFVLHSMILTNQSVNDIRGGGELHVSQKIINAIDNTNEEVLEEFKMTGEILAFTAFFIIGLIMVIFVKSRNLLIVTSFIFIIALAGFNSLQQTGLVLLSLLLAFIALIKAFQTVAVNNEEPDSVFGGSSLGR